MDPRPLFRPFPTPHSPSPGPLPTSRRSLPSQLPSPPLPSHHLIPFALPVAISLFSFEFGHIIPFRRERACAGVHIRAHALTHTRALILPSCSLPLYEPLSLSLSLPPLTPNVPSLRKCLVSPLIPHPVGYAPVFDFIESGRSGRRRGERRKNRSCFAKNIIKLKFRVFVLSYDVRTRIKTLIF